MQAGGGLGLLVGLLGGGGDGLRKRNEDSCFGQMAPPSEPMDAIPARHILTPPPTLDCFCTFNDRRIQRNRTIFMATEPSLAARNASSNQGPSV